MTRYANHPLAGNTPWPASTSVEAPCGPPAPRQEATYTCTRKCTFTLTFAAGAVPPPAWDCRCGGKATLDAAPPGASTEVRLPGYTTPGVAAKTKGPISHWEQVRSRRTVRELESLLAERLAAVGGQRGIWA